MRMMTAKMWTGKATVVLLALLLFTAALTGFRAGAPAARAAAAGAGLRGSWGSIDTHYVQENDIEITPETTGATQKNFDRITYEDVCTSAPVTKLSKTAWKGDHVNACLVLWTSDAPAYAVTVTAGDFVSGDSAASIPAGNIDIRFQKRVIASLGKNQAPAPYEEIPDLLYTDEPVNLDRSFLQPVWVRVNVPYSAPAGVYQAELTVTDESGDVLTFSYELEVLGIAYPVEATSFDLCLMSAGSPGEVWETLGVPHNLYFSDYALELLEPYYDRYLGREELNGKYIMIAVNSNENRPIDITRTAEGTWRFDFGKLNRFLRFLSRYEKLTVISFAGYGNTGPYFDEASGQTKIVNNNWTDPVYQSMFPALQQALVTDLQDERFAERFRFAQHIDEKTEGETRWWMEQIRNNSPEGFFLLETAINNSQMFFDHQDLFDNFWTVQLVLQEAGSSERTFMDIIERRKALGLDTTIYTCAGNFPDSLTRNNPVENTWISWYCLKIGGSGFSRWSFWYFHEFSSFTTDNMVFASGDAFFLYPGAKSSVRYERLAEGVTDANKAKFLMANGSDAVKGLIEAAIDEMSLVSDNGGWGSFDEYGSRYDRQLVDYAAETAALQNALLEATRAYIAENGAQPESIAPVENKRVAVGEQVTAEELINVPQGAAVSGVTMKTAPDTSRPGKTRAVVTAGGTDYTVSIEVVEKKEVRPIDIYDLDEYKNAAQNYGERLGIAVDKVTIGDAYPVPKGRNVGLIVGLSVGGAVVAAGGACAAILLVRKKKRVKKA